MEQITYLVVCSISLRFYLNTLSEFVRRDSVHFFKAADKLAGIFIAYLFADVIEFPLSCFQQFCSFSQFKILDGFREGTSSPLLCFPLAILEGPSGLLLKHTAQIRLVVMEFCCKVMERNRAIVIVHIIDHIEYPLIP